MTEQECIKQPLRHKLPLKQLNRIAKRPPVDIEFQDLHYEVRDSYSKGGWRSLLKSVSGQFRSGELTAILGPSGAGKSTLLNILAGYVTAGVKGSIKVNGRPREMKVFNKYSSYIMQEDVIQPRLTVREAMLISARLKLGAAVSEAAKVAVIDEVINLLGLQTCYETLSEHLSGGQRKRLVVALELVNNPPVIFLDEPTSGLDNVAIKQCIELLQKITRLGRTVICTIHQPPSSVFQNFDQVYVMANAYCVYNGSPAQLVPFLDTINCPCPSTYTPADYIIEIVQSAPEAVSILSNQINNGKLNMKKEKEECLSFNEMDICEIYQDTTQRGIVASDVTFPLSVYQQFVILLSRQILQIKRNKTMLYIQFFHHVFSGFILGGIFYGTGNDASQTLAIFKYCVSVNVFFIYTYVMTPVLLFPLEVKLLKREYFNRWYGLKAYYLALTTTTVPLLIVLGTMFLTIVYFMTNQPLDANRFTWFLLMGLAMGICSQGLGYVIGSFCNITAGSVVGSSTLAPILALAVYGMGYKSAIEPFMKVLMGFSYLRYGIVGFCSALFLKRQPLECDELYCHYRDPTILLEDMGMKGHSYVNQFFCIIGFTIFFRITAYIVLKYRLTSELSNKIVYLATKIVRLKE